MSRRNWKTWVPRSPVESIRGCVEAARDQRNRSTDRLSFDYLALNNGSSLYKWQADGRLPLSLILPLEHACGYPLITRYLAAAHGKLLVDIPTGRSSSAEDMQRLQQVLHEAAGALMAFYAGRQNTQQTLDAIRAGLESLAWHHGNVQQHDHPQLDLGSTDHE
ncbi:hypothetical protein N7414_15900 [Pseudomonas sp. GD04087]|uniref:hypothetical protein n=1 Tax=Pseudomonas TaxID=286 RepID=UPI00244A2F5B|nr:MULTISPECIES: hypothetical protein [unclassified Pseudomonas]MDH0290608.1 hypothetical protein [Pseudomonas sp. GD04087]MDH1051525.1 hypothetical protein [Pseudomonas sp. GD03903]MDH2002748.1 hypothetical protein [Pseudomonas sp. GD03691]